ncbi:hypothetical protein MTO96_034086 [Rhipicephalus appendiculatus]
MRHLTQPAPCLLLCHQVTQERLLLLYHQLIPVHLVLFYHQLIQVHLLLLYHQLIQVHLLLLLPPAYPAVAPRTSRPGRHEGPPQIAGRESLSVQGYWRSTLRQRSSRNDSSSQHAPLSEHKINPPIFQLAGITRWPSHHLPPRDRTPGPLPPLARTLDPLPLKARVLVIRLLTPLTPRLLLHHHVAQERLLLLH